MASVSTRLAVLAMAGWAVAGLGAGGAVAQTHSTGSPTLQIGPVSDDTTPPGTGAADLPHGPIVNGKQLQPRPGQPPSRQQVNQVDQLLKATPPDPAANGPIVQPRDLFGNPLGGSPGLNPNKP